MSDIESERKKEQVELEQTFWDRIPEFKWWVTPLNILLVSIFLIIIDIFTKPNAAFLWIDWAWWPIGGLLFAYILGLILFRRPAIAWLFFPILMIVTSILLLVADIISGPNDWILGLDWAIIPIAAMIVFGVLIPIITKLGQIREKPIDKFRKALEKFNEQEIKEKSNKKS